MANLFDYVKENWIESTIWPPAAWSIFMQSVRTNNDVEGWHKRINSKARKTNLCLYLLIQVLHEEAQLINVQVRLISDHKLRRHQRKTYRHLQAKIFEHWEAFNNKEKTATQLLRSCSQ